MQSQTSDTLNFDFQRIIDLFAEKGGTYSLYKGVETNELIRQLISNASIVGNLGEGPGVAQRLLQVAFLTMLKEQIVRLSSSIDRFNSESVGALSTKLQAFIDETRNSTKDLLQESKWLGRFTLALAVATVVLAIFTGWMAYSTQTLAKEANLNMSFDQRKQELEQEEARLKQERARFQEFTAQKSKALDEKDKKIVELQGIIQGLMKSKK